MIRPVQRTQSADPVQRHRDARHGRTHSQARTPLALSKAKTILEGPHAQADRATAAFVRRTLCSHRSLDGRPAPIDELLPPLTSSNELDLQLYGIIAVVLRQFVQEWYNKITPDHVFVDEIIAIIAHVTRSLEERARHVDWEAVVLDEIPSILLDHLKAYRVATQSPTTPLSSSPRLIYHTLRPHPALFPVPSGADSDNSSDQARNEEIWRQLLASGLLAVVLPTDDLENGCLRALVGEVISEMVISNILSERLSEPWVLWDIIGKSLESKSSKKQAPTKAPSTSPAKPPSKPPETHPEVLGLSTNDESPKTAAGNSRPNKAVRFAQDDYLQPKTARTAVSSLSDVFWRFISSAVLFFTTLRATALALASAPTLPSRARPLPITLTEKQSELPKNGASVLGRPPKRAMLSTYIFNLAGSLVELQQRMPWLHGLLSLLHGFAMYGFMRIGAADGKLDRLLSHTFQTKVLDPTRIPSSLRTIRASVFPNDTFPKASSAPNAGPGPANTTAKASNDSAPANKSLPLTQPEIQAIRRHCARALLNEIPASVAKAYLCPTWGPSSLSVSAPSSFSASIPTDLTRDVAVDAQDHLTFAEPWTEDAISQIEGMLNVFSDKYMNKHMMFSLLELFVVRLLPEMGEKGVEELMRDRLGEGW